MEGENNMEYTGRYRTLFSEQLGHEVNILEYRSDHNPGRNYCYEFCTRCGKPIKRIMFVVQDAETDVEEMYLGSDCIKHFC